MFLIVTYLFFSIQAFHRYPSLLLSNSSFLLIDQLSQKHVRRGMILLKETEYMRRQRDKMGADDFEPLTMIGKDAFGEEKEAKKEAFKKYLESSGVLDSFTKVLVSLYEQNDKPSSALEFIQQKLGGPSVSEYEKLQAEKSDLQIKYNELMKLFKR